MSRPDIAYLLILLIVAAGGLIAWQVRRHRARERRQANRPIDLSAPRT